VKKILINSVLLLIFTGFLLVPNYPYLRSFIVKTQTTFFNADISIEKHKTLIGDMAYLSAIMSRADDENSKTNKEAPPPETNNTINHLVFITPTGIEFTGPLVIEKSYTDFVKFFLSSVYLKIPSPPPEFIS
jgi:hypothetical protein